MAGEAAPEEAGLALAVPRPNPTVGITAVTFTARTSTDVRVTVLDVLGREVAVLADGPVAAGTHEATFDASRLAPSAYVVRLAAEVSIQTRRLTVVR